MNAKIRCRLKLALLVSMRLRTCSVMALTWAVTYLALTHLATVGAQESPAKGSSAQSKEQAKLVDGLLDLLREPDLQPADAKPQLSDKSQPAAGASTGPSTGSAAAVGRPANKMPAAQAPAGGRSRVEAPAAGGFSTGRSGVGGSATGRAPPSELSSGGTQSGSDASLPAQASLGRHPLTAVHSNMRSAAERLGRGLVGADTLQLQGSIVHQLDELIDQLDQQDPSQGSPQQNQQSSVAQRQPSSQSGGEQSPSASSGQTPSAGSQPGDEQRSESGPGGQGRGAQAGTASEVAVDLADPERLQQNVWGQLPEQMRKQMQSRMVESFLPSYRPQIEAYFRKLLESEEF